MATRYTQAELRKQARRDIRDEAKAAKIKARLADWYLIVDRGQCSLVSIGERIDTGARFEVACAI